VEIEIAHHLANFDVYIYLLLGNDQISFQKCCKVMNLLGNFDAVFEHLDCLSFILTQSNQEKSKIFSDFLIWQILTQLEQVLKLFEVESMLSSNSHLEYINKSLFALMSNKLLLTTTSYNGSFLDLGLKEQSFILVKQSTFHSSI
jgi:hypothetical protein